MGHLEIVYKNKIYSYGNYNPHSRILKDLIGDGILLIADKMKYIKYAVTKKDRFLVLFGIKLTDKQKVAIESRIDKLYNKNVEEHLTDYDLYKKGLLDTKPTDMSSDYAELCEGKFKKITKGKLKKFFVVKTNCVSVVEYILQGTGNKVLAINGLITPGTYYSYLNNEFLKPNSNVVSKKIYTKKDFKKE